MSKLTEIKEKIEKQLRAIEYEIYEYKDQLAKDICEYERNEIKKELVYLVGKSAALKDCLQVIEKVLNSDNG